MATPGPSPLQRPKSPSFLIIWLNASLELLSPEGGNGLSHMLHKMVLTEELLPARLILEDAFSVLAGLLAALSTVPPGSMQEEAHETGAC